MRGAEHARSSRPSAGHRPSPHLACTEAPGRPAAPRAAWDHCLLATMRRPCRHAVWAELCRRSAWSHLAGTRRRGGGVNKYVRRPLDPARPWNHRDRLAGVGPRPATIDRVGAADRQTRLGPWGAGPGPGLARGRGEHGQAEQASKFLHRQGCDQLIDCIYICIPVPRRD